MIDPLLVTMDEACRLLSMSRRTLDRMRSENRLATRKIGARRYVPMAEVRRIASLGHEHLDKAAAA